MFIRIWENFYTKSKKGYSVKDSFIAAVDETASWSDFGKCAVFTTKDNENDRLWGYGKVASNPKPYRKSKRGYKIITYRY